MGVPCPTVPRSHPSVEGVGCTLRPGELTPVAVGDNEAATGHVRPASVALAQRQSSHGASEDSDAGLNLRARTVYGVHVRDARR